MKWLVAMAVSVIIILQVRLWYGEGSYLQVKRLQKERVMQQDAVKKLKERNQILQAEVQDLKLRLSAVEERARTDLGMIRQGETFYQPSLSEE